MHVLGVVSVAILIYTRVKCAHAFHVVALRWIRCSLVLALPCQRYTGTRASCPPAAHHKGSGRGVCRCAQVLIRSMGEY